MASPGFEGQEHFLGTIASSGGINTPNSAPREWEEFDPIGPGGHDGAKTDTGFPVGQSKVGFFGVAGGEISTPNAGDGYNSDASDTMDGGGMGGMPPFTVFGS